MPPTETLVTAARIRKRSKVRSVWISFAGRIAAQIIGAIATVTLGVMVLGKGQQPAKPADHTPAAKPSVLIATPIRTHGETVIVMLPMGKDGQVDTTMASAIAESYEKTKAPIAIAARRRSPLQPATEPSGDSGSDAR